MTKKIMLFVSAAVILVSAVLLVNIHASSRGKEIPLRTQAISAGEVYTMVIKSDDSLWMWGGRDFSFVEIPVKVMEDVAWVSSSLHTMAIKTDGSLWAWGRNSFGQLGDGTTIWHDSPVKIMENVSAVSAGMMHTVALKNDGSVWAWGLNDDGQIGDESLWH